jgi:hypothetical protein
VNPVSVVLDALMRGAAQEAVAGTGDPVVAAYARLKQLVAARIAETATQDASISVGTSSLADVLSGAGPGEDDLLVAAAREVLDLLRGDSVRSGLLGSDLRGSHGVQVGDGNYQVNLHLGKAPAAPRSAYLEQVRQIAPPQLHERDSEMVSLVAFCTEPNLGPYMWWRAPAWTGKSALMSWFVLHPPPNVLVISFFVTARYAGQNDRVAFAEVVLEQLAGILEQDMPTYLTEATREIHLRGMLAEASDICQQQGRRLVLIVDGLDEDRGVTTGPDAYSIAALLPTRPPDGLRIICAGRPNPPIPADVPDDHPLRDPAIVRVLGQSRWADVVRVDMQRELKRLLQGTPIEQDLLGLVTAAGGGLRGRDLAELTGLSVQEVEEHLQTVAGRTFTSRASQWQADMMYILGHEELQVAAASFLGESRLSLYRQRLHAWSEAYRRENWPIGTPEYLLRGYYRMLHAINDIPRMVALATDQHRQNRMLDVSGGDTAALTEITDAQEVIITLGEPDLLSMARLAIRRTSIIGRNANIPTKLPALWAILGNITRAEALAHSIIEPIRRAQALSALVKPVAASGDVNRTLMLAQQAEVVICAIEDIPQRNGAIQGLAEALAAAGHFERAHDMAGAITEPSERITAMAALIKVTVASSDFSRGKRAFAQLADSDERIAALTALASSRNFKEFQEFIPALPSQVERIVAWEALVKAIAADGNIERAEQVARAITGLTERSAALTALVAAVAAAGDFDRADEILRAIDPGQRDQALTALAAAITADGDFERGEQVLRSIANPELQAQELLWLTAVAADSGDLERAEEAARAISNQDRRTKALTAVAFAAIDRGYSEQAKRLNRILKNSSLTYRLRYPWLERWDVEDSELGLSSPMQAAAQTAMSKAAAIAGFLERAAALASAITVPDRQVEAFMTLVHAVIKKGKYELAKVLLQEAIRAADFIEIPFHRAQALAALAEISAAIGDLGQVRALLQRAEELAHSISAADQRAEILMASAKIAAITGDFRHVEAVVDSITNPRDRAEALTAAATAAAAHGKLEHAQTLAQQAEMVARAITNPGRQIVILTALAKAAIKVGDAKQARALMQRAAASRAIDSLNAEIEMIVPLAQIAAFVGDPEPIGQAEAAAHAITNPVRRVKALTALAEAISDAGDFEKAEAISNTIKSPYLRARALTVIATRAAASGNLEISGTLKRRAEEMAFSLDTPDRKVAILMALLSIEAQSNDREHISALARLAAQAARGMTDPYRRATVQTSLIAPIASINGREQSAVIERQAQKSAQAVTDPFHRGVALSGLAKAIAVTGDLEKAFEIARSITSPYMRGEALLGVAAALADSGDREGASSLIRQAEQAANAITNHEHQAQALLAVAVGLADSGDREGASSLIRQAEQAANAITNHEQRADILVNVTEAAGDLGDLEWAEAIARSISNLDQQAEALITLAADAPRDRAGSMIARAFTIGDWTEFMEILAAIQPATALAIVSEYLDGSEIIDY